MKKVFMVLIAFVFAGSSALYSQDGEGTGPEGGDLLIEITGTPFAGSSLLNFGQFRARYVLNDKLVPRLGVSFDLSNANTTPDLVTNNSTFTVMPGVEYHLTAEGPYRAYAAGSFIIGSRSASRESATGPSVDGSTQVPSGTNYSFSTGSRSYFQYGLEIATGAEYHFNSRFYMGVEIGFQFYKNNYKEVMVDGELYQDATSATYGNLTTNNSFRIGFKLL